MLAGEKQANGGWYFPLDTETERNNQDVCSHFTCFLMMLGTSLLNQIMVWQHYRKTSSIFLCASHNITVTDKTHVTWWTSAWWTSVSPALLSVGNQQTVHHIGLVSFAASPSVNTMTMVHLKLLVWWQWTRSWQAISCKMEFYSISTARYSRGKPSQGHRNKITRITKIPCLRHRAVWSLKITHIV